MVASITSISPSLVPVDTATTLTIVGTGLYPVSKVQIAWPGASTLDCTSVVASGDGTKVTCTTPPAPNAFSGNAAVFVTVGGGGNILTYQQSELEDGTIGGWAPVGQSSVGNAVPGFNSGHALYLGSQSTSQSCSAHTQPATPVNPSTQYQLSFVTRPGPSAPGRVVKASAEWSTSAGAAISTVDFGQLTSVAGSWQRLTATLYSPSNAGNVTILLSVATPGVVESHLFDAITLTLTLDTVVTGYVGAQGMTPPSPTNPNSYCSTPAVLTLTLGDTTIDLMDVRNGYRVAEVDIGYPDVREDDNMRADQHGTVDLTRLFGARAITISGSIVPSGYGSRQKTWHQLGPFLNPAARASLTYQIDSDVGPRTIIVRPTAVSGPYNSRQVSAFSLGFKAADPIIYDATTNTAYVWASTGLSGGGRFYDLVFPRVYAAGGSSAVYVKNKGDQTVYPKLRIYGPITGAQIQEQIQYPTGAAFASVLFKSTYIIPGGSWVDVDCKARTALLNGTTSVYDQLQYGPSTAWPSLPGGVQTVWSLNGTNISGITQLQIIWQDGYLL